MPELTISVTFTDESDCDYLRHRCVSAVDEVVGDFIGEGDDPARNDGEVTVAWDVDEEKP